MFFLIKKKYLILYFRLRIEPSFKMRNRLDLLPNEILVQINSHLSTSEVLICLGGDDNDYK